MVVTVTDMVMALVMAILMAMATIATVTDILIEITTGVTVMRIQGMDRIIGGKDLELQAVDILANGTLGND